ncbi:MAG: signal peptide peptidase SppA [Candidatus Poribacteria bacterium]|nr:signal peptide peptidase SppA [Candidatus Poribacteria bacterium]MDE0506499.1 signal peptide peptidase SppA [Candidatus Poribacteria bacterium]
MSRPKIGFIAALLALVVSHPAAAAPKTQTPLPSNSVAVSDDPLATVLNPAGLAVSNGFNLCYLRTYSGASSGDDAFFVSNPGIGFGMEFGGVNVDFARYTLSSGSRLLGSLYWGTGYSWINSDDESYDEFSSLSLGLMLRRRYLSLGIVARDLNRPKLLDKNRTYDFGLAFRPRTWRVTFSLDARKTENIDGIDLDYAVEFRPVQAVLVRANLNESGSFDIRFGITLGQVGLGAFNRFDENREHRDGLSYIHVSNVDQNKPRLRSKIFLETRIRDAARTLRIAKRDPDVAGALIRVENTDLGLGRLQELRDVVSDFKSAGKRTICYGHNYSTGTYIVASACDRIVLHPSGEVRLIGLRSETSFYKKTLDKLGLRADLEHIGDYKTASDPFTRERMSDAHREVQNSILDDLYDQVCESIAAERKLTQNQIKEQIDRGPFTAKQAVEHGVVDRLAYRDELETITKELMRGSYSLVKAKLYLNTETYRPDWEIPLPKIAIIEAAGTMVTGDSFWDPFTGTQAMGSTTIARAVRSVRLDDSVKAVVLRIDSGGGLVIAADIIWRELMLLKEVKPLIVSMADVAGSGGYYIAVPAHVIVAEPGTITGSIGVIGGKFSLKGLYDKIGVRKEIIKRGKHADFYTDYGDYPPEERAIVRRQISEIYDEFIAKVADARDMTKDEVDRIARGRVWTGKQALENGLVDQLGGLNHAIMVARKRAGLESKEVELVRLPREHWFTQWLKAYNTAKTFVGGSTDGRRGSLLDLLRQHRTFLLTPYAIEVND